MEGLGRSRNAYLRAGPQDNHCFRSYNKPVNRLNVVQTYQPESKTLQNYVELFYTFSGDKPDEISYIAFPHVNTAISFFKGATIERENNNVYISSTANESKLHVEILGKYTHPVFVHYKGKFDEIAIVFKPLGMNHFFENDLCTIAPQYTQPLQITGWIEFSGILFNAATVSEQLEILEIFLVKNLRVLEIQRMENAIKYLEDFEANYSVEQIAELCGLTLKTFQRSFFKHLACSPLEYKRIARFRHSLRDKLISKELKTLTSVSYASNYYDQSYFIREYRKLTDLNPKQFFDSITALDQARIVWKIR